MGEEKKSPPTAAARGVTQSAVIRQALAQELAQVPNPGKKPQPAA